MNEKSFNFFKDFLSLDLYKDLRKIFMDSLENRKNIISGLALKSIREKNNLSQKSFGEIINKKQNTVLKYELGISKINLKVWSEVVKKFNITYDDLEEIFFDSHSKTIYEKKYLLEENEITKNICVFFENEIINGFSYEAMSDLNCLMVEFIENNIKEYTNDLLKKIFPFRTSDSENTLSHNKINSSLLETIKANIENLENSFEKNIKIEKLNKIEKDIENYTIFLLKQNGFID